MPMRFHRIGFFMTLREVAKSKMAGHECQAILRMRSRIARLSKPGTSDYSQVST
ncbi:hypothetical protein [Paraburkholderia sp. GAS42]|jgi:hypothetical protein|uniref:hypothetical protein n=1 Tax=Paraburkholderia sp. GAS42 TaxID=3035135 RepID=UPI003D218CB1